METGRTPRALLWDSRNTSSLLAAHTLRANGWIVDSLEDIDSPWLHSKAFNGARTLVANSQDEALERVLWSHPLDALFLYGDDQIRWLLARWDRLPASIRRHLPERDSLEIALSKSRSMELAAKLGFPVLPTEECTSPSEIPPLFKQLPPGEELVLKGEGGSAGSAVRAVREGVPIRPRDWEALTLHSPRVMVQRRLRGPKLFVTVVYEHGLERAACAHEKIATWPSSFGVSAIGVTRYVQEVHDYTQSLFEALQWHGLANIEFRQDLEDGRWYFMEINPRVNASLGIQASAGVDVVSSWAAVCQGKGDQLAPGRSYHSGLRYRWTIPTMALSLRRPWALPLRQLLSPGAYSDWSALDPGSRVRALRTAFWEIRNR